MRIGMNSVNINSIGTSFMFFNYSANKPILYVNKGNHMIQHHFKTVVNISPSKHCIQDISVSILYSLLDRSLVGIQET